ncbi:transcriptional regulator [Fictibacillus macauensis ZFHKF-1]|uniref:Transcriptional regulator n=1 Tax=Fictibacillus macauensis ZFHKF-1 TaxID=1196324 RepID=I8UFU1_9BACL|nr:GntR family transcriptional regulator [Fictibacillus macauensis]EIT85688.1 transcriptional regulator [Fictibacillus macauensis ZFHKF-1]
MKQRSTDVIEQKLIAAILEGTYMINEELPSERDLAELVHSGRPAVREALQRLERDGWITIRQSKPAFVNDFWRQGNLSTIVNILRSYEHVPDHFVQYMLELRVVLLPVCVKDSITFERMNAYFLLKETEHLINDATAYAQFDWQLQKGLAALSPNPIYLLIFNSFQEIYPKLATYYFSQEKHRIASFHYYQQLMECMIQNEADRAAIITEEVMRESAEQWKKDRRGLHEE